MPFMLTVAILFAALLLVLYFNYRKSSSKEEIPTDEPIQSLDSFNTEERLRVEVSNSDRLQLVTTMLSNYHMPTKEELNPYIGRRTRATVSRVGNGFENIHVSDVEDLSRPGVYAIYAGEQLLYVGKTYRPIVTRLREHAKAAKYPMIEGGAQQNFLYQAIRDYPDIIDARVLAHAYLDDKAEIDRLEVFYINLMNPICNIAR